MAIESVVIFAGMLDPIYDGSRVLVSHDIGFVTDGFILGTSIVEGDTDVDRFIPLGNISLSGTMFDLTFDGMGQSFEFADQGVIPPRGSLATVLCRFGLTRTIGVIPVTYATVPREVTITLYYRKDTGLLATN